MTKNEFLFQLKVHGYTDVVRFRSKTSLLHEWGAHKLLYQLGILESHTESVDLNYPQSWYEKIGYFVVGGIAVLFY